MDISKTTEYQRHLKACEEKCGKGTFAYGNQSVQTFPESLIKEAAQDVYNRLSGHGLSYGAIVLILDIVQSYLRFRSDSQPL